RERPTGAGADAAPDERADDDRDLPQPDDRARGGLHRRARARPDRRTRDPRRAGRARRCLRTPVPTPPGRGLRPARAMTEPLPAGAPLAPGYEVIEHLKRTLSLDVYDVWSTEIEARCIAKTLRGDHLDDERARRRLTREGWLLETLTHPHIVRIYETLTEPQ